MTTQIERDAILKHRNEGTLNKSGTNQRIHLSSKRHATVNRWFNIKNGKRTRHAGRNSK